MSKIHCDICPLNRVQVDTLCERYCSDMAEYRAEVRAEAIDECIKSIKSSYPSEDAIFGSLMIMGLEQLKEQNDE